MHEKLQPSDVTFDWNFGISKYYTPDSYQDFEISFKNKEN